MLGEIILGSSVLASAVSALAFEIYVAKRISKVTTQLNHNKEAKSFLQTALGVTGLKRKEV